MQIYFNNPFARKVILVQDMIPVTPKKNHNPPYLISRTAQSTARAVSAIYVNDGF